MEQNVLKLFEALVDNLIQILSPLPEPKENEIPLVY